MARIPESEIERLKNEVSVERLIDHWVKLCRPVGLNEMNPNITGGG